MRWVLIVEDDPRISNSICAALPEDVAAVETSTVSGALAVVMEGRPLWAAIIDVNLGDGSGLDVAQALRERSPDLPILIMTGNPEPEVVSRAQLLGAQFVSKPFSADNVRAFLDWARRMAHLAHSRLARLLDQLVQRHGLSPRERELVLLASIGTPPSELPVHMNVSVNTVKTTTKRILRKCEVGSIGELVQPLQRQALRADSDATPT